MPEHRRQDARRQCSWLQYSLSLTGAQPGRHAVRASSPVAIRICHSYPIFQHNLLASPLTPEYRKTVTEEWVSGVSPSCGEGRSRVREPTGCGRGASGAKAQYRVYGRSSLGDRVCRNELDHSYMSPET